MQNNQRSTGQLLQRWRKQRRLSQLDLALTADISPKHISFIETGRSQPSRDMLLRLADHLNIPPRDQNAMLVQAGFAPHYAESAFSADSFEDGRRIIELVLRNHEPFPAMALDRHWNVIMHNPSFQPVLSTIAPELCKPPINALRISLHPAGIAPQVINFAEWRAHLLMRVRRQLDAADDSILLNLYREIESYPHANQEVEVSADRLAIPLVLRTPFGIRRFYTTTLVFGGPLNVSLSELAIETFIPADES